MSRPKASRMEKQTRNIGRLLLLVTVTLVVITIGMTARYGWNVTAGDAMDKAWQAAIFGTIDIAGVGFSLLVGVCWGLGYRRAGIAIAVLAILCAAVTYQAIVGFQASSRETKAQNQENAVKLSTNYLGWVTDTITKKIHDEKGKAKAETLTQGIEAAGAQVKDQIKMMQDGGLAAPDGQAATFARIFSTSEKSARSWVTSGTSLLIIIITHGAAIALGFLKQRLEPEATAQSLADARQFYGGNPPNSANSSHQFSREAAREDLNRMLATGFDLRKYGAFSQLSRRWGWTINVTIRWLYAQDDLARVLPARGKRKTEPTTVVRLNGNGRAHAT